MSFLCCSPSIVVFYIRDGSCEIVSQTGLFLTYVLLLNSVFVFQTVMNIGFIVGLRQYRMKKTKSNRTKVEFSASREENEVPSSGKKNISINAAPTENRHGFKRFGFSTEDLKAIKFTFSIMTMGLIKMLLFVTSFYGVKLVNENLGKNINFWAYFELFLVYWTGTQFFILFLSKDKLRSCIRERWSGFFRKR